VTWGPLRCHIYGTTQVAIKQDGRFMFVIHTQSYKAAMLQEFLYILCLPVLRISYTINYHCTFQFTYW